MSLFDVLVIGEINPDLILSGNVIPEFGQVEKLVHSAKLEIGSSSVITACGLAKLGLKVGFIGKCGQDMFGNFMLAEMTSRGIDVSGVICSPSLSTGLTVILSEHHERALLTYQGAISALRSEDITVEMLVKARHIHVASYYIQDGLRSGLADLFKQARSMGITTSLDTNYDPTERWEGIDELLAQTSVFLPNEKEALSITAQNDLEVAANRLAEKADIVVIKLGSQGAIAAQTKPEPQLDYEDVIPVQVLDTTGAGDSFNAGFLYGFLNGWSIRTSLRSGVICGSLSTRGVGGSATQANQTELMEAL